MTLIVSGNRNTLAALAVWKYDLDLAFDFGVDNAATQWGAAIDADGYFTVVGDRSGTPTRTTRRYNSAGTLQQSVDFGSEVLCVATDSAGNVYTGGAVNTETVTTRKHTSSLDTTWSVNHGARVRAIAVDSSGNVYTAGDRISNLTTRKYDSAGTLLWSADHGAAVYGIAVDSSGNVYTVGVLTGGVTTRKYDSAGTAITTGWPVSHGAQTNGVDVDASGNVYTAGNRVSNLTTRKYDSSGTLLWSADHGASTYAVKCAGEVIFVGGARTAADPRRTLRKYSSAGSELTSADMGNTTARGMAVLLGDLVSAIPGLPLPIALGIPSSTCWTEIPALAFPVALGVPASEFPGQVTPDFADLPLTVAELALYDYRWTPYTGMSQSQLVTVLSPIYTAYITSPGGGIVTAPVSGLQCRRRLGASTWLNVEIPYTPAWWIALQSCVGGELLVYAGVRTRDGAEGRGLFLRATITESAADYAAQRGAIRLTARVANPSYVATTRTLMGVRRLSRNDERWSAACNVDPLLRPNDTVLADDASFIAGIIEYRIFPHDAVMTVTESA